MFLTLTVAAVLTVPSVLLMTVLVQGAHFDQLVEEEAYRQPRTSGIASPSPRRSAYSSRRQAPSRRSAPLEQAYGSS